MAGKGRTYAKVSLRIWQDKDWKALSHDAQWLYVLLLGQPDLRTSGCQPLLPQRWASLAADVTQADLERWLKELEAAHFVVVDRSTDEVLIRTYIRNDGVLDGDNSNNGKGVWRAWSAIWSAELQQVVVDHVPDNAWMTKMEPPREARQMRRLDTRSNGRSDG